MLLRIYHFQVLEHLNIEKISIAFLNSYVVHYFGI